MNTTDFSGLRKVGKYLGLDRYRYTLQDTGNNEVFLVFIQNRIDCNSPGFVPHV